jgi:glycosyltransferase involved in cell wall biosynthesis
MKVLQVGKYYPPHRGGMETHLADLCNQLKNQVDLRVLVAQTGKVTRTDEVDGVEVTRLGTPLHLLANPVNPELASRIRKSTADIVHLHWPNPLALLAYMASGSQAKLVITYHSDIVRQKIAGALFQPLLDRVLRRALVLATSPNYVESSPVLRRFRENCRVVPLGIDIGKMRQADPEKVVELRKRYGYNMILATGRHIYYKGFQHLLAAMPDVNGHLVLAGDGHMRAEFEATVARLNLSHKVTFAGQVPDEELRALYAASSVFAFPSVARSEAFGLVQLEAMALGKPVVNTSIDSGVPFVSRHEETGLTVEPGNPGQLAAALNTLLGDETLRARYGEAGRQRAERFFTVEAMARETYRVYEEALGIGPRVAAASAA